MTGKDFLDDFNREIYQFEPDFMRPAGKVEQNDKLLRVVEDDTCKRLYSMGMFHTREAQRLQVEIAYEPDEEGRKRLAADVQDHERSGLLAMNLFWAALRRMYDLQGVVSLNVREGWQLVEQPCGHGTHPLMRLFGGQTE